MMEEPCVYPINKALDIVKRLNEGDDDLIYVIKPIIGDKTAHIKVFDDNMEDKGYLQCQQ
jgi:pyridoxal/pyridoxine/pyridoxamine kinase